MTPVFSAVIARKEAVVKRLLQEPGADVNIADAACNLLLLTAIQNGDDRIVANCLMQEHI